MTELLNVDPKEEDFECREEFPGSVFTGFFVGVKFSGFCCVEWYLIVYSSDSLNLMIHVLILS